MGYGVRTRTALVIYPAVTVRAFGWNGHGPRRPLPRVRRRRIYLSAHRSEEGAHPYAHRYSSLPPATPRHLCLHSFCNFDDFVYSSSTAVVGTRAFLFLAAVCKNCANKGVAKETSPNAVALNKCLRVAKAAKRKMESCRLDRSIRPRQRPDIKKEPILWGGRAGIKSDTAASHGRRAAPQAERSAERRRAWRGPCP